MAAGETGSASHGPERAVATDAGAESAEPTTPVPSGGTHEWPVPDPPRRPEVENVPAGAERDVLLWQRWARYLGAALMIAAAAGLHAREPSGLWPSLAVLAMAYAGVTAIVAWFLEYGSAETLPPRLPALIMGADLAAAAGTVYLTAPPRDYDRLLVLGLVVAQVAVVYYGFSCAVWGLALTGLAYVVGTLALPPAVSGAGVDTFTVVADTATFLFAGLVLVYTFGTFRSRMNALRRFCRDVEVGELGGSFDPQSDRRPDDLTLLARSVDEMRQRLIELIGTDPLTGCLNRRALETRLARDCRHARRRGTPLAVLAVDVDHFKSINDNFGHPFGDYVLQGIAEIMQETARDTDAVARLGGDEFILVLPDTGWQGATSFAERLRRNVDDHIFGDQITSLQVTISVGVAVARTVDDQPPDSLLAEADRSLYRAKSAGRNRISA
jgi:diguanylate cyclase (GGDEF)-like protein